ncbi:hypothetical protein [Pseudochelatococcus contaminans]|uniref:Integrase n=1 Tax=Pseudochelatococcus contaminans TaxID=1538103 RepID=A0A7W6EIF9_9HYPH|nr:hypothetical protein [Pseudochelatococcus contaminans]MBB3811099.1 hypothetical protein [Pseudochelatococcus contaminans]
MGHSQFDDASRERAAWNTGKKVSTKRPFTPKQIWAIRFFLDRERRIRDRALPSEALLRTGSRGSSILRAGHLSRHSLKTGRTRSLCNITASIFSTNELVEMISVT